MRLSESQYQTFSRAIVSILFLLYQPQLVQRIPPVGGGEEEEEEAAAEDAEAMEGVAILWAEWVVWQEVEDDAL